MLLSPGFLIIMYCSYLNENKTTVHISKDLFYEFPERICGNTHPAEFVTNKPALYLNFVSARHNDSLDINKQGFELHYSSVRKGKSYIFILP
jgi:hypothetical protein